MSAKPNRLQQTSEGAEKRVIDRLDLRPSDGIKGVFRGNGQEYDCQIRDISPGGLCLVFPNSSAPELKANETYAVEVVSLQKDRFTLAITTRWIAKLGETHTRCGCTINHPPTIVALEPDALKIPDYYPITGSIYKPYMYYERAPMKVISIGRDLWEIRIYDTEIFVFVGAQLEIYLNTSVSAQKPVKMEIQKLVSVDSEGVNLLVKPQTFNKKLQNWLAKFLIFNLNVSPINARDYNIQFKSLADGFRFRYVKSREDYEAVLQLRFNAYKAAGKVPDGKTHLDMQAPLDSYSRILAVYHGEKIIGSVAISFPENELTLDTERAFPNGYPNSIPPKNQLIEIARLCTDVEYRKTDLLVRIFEYTYKTLHCGDRKYILTSTDNKLWPLYKKLGFRKTGMSYAHPFLAGLNHDIIVGKVATPDSAESINPLAWNYLWRDMGRFLETSGSVQRSGLSWVRVRLYELIGFVLRINRKEKN